ncbi:MAG: hypothetical protein ACYC35_19530, partial [Pirellulales bacterium]
CPCANIVCRIGRLAHAGDLSQNPQPRSISLLQIHWNGPYLLPSLNVKLIPQLEKLKPGTRIVSHDFDMEGVKPDRVINMLSKDDDEKHTLYLWTIPLKNESTAK